MSGRRSFAPFPAEIPGESPDSGSPGGGTVTDVTGTAPIVITSVPTATPNVTITPATDVAAGSMSAADKTKLDGIDAGAAPPPDVAVNTGGATAPATTQTITASVTVGPSGTITFGGQMGCSTSGGTAIATDVYEINPQLDGGALPGGSVVGSAASEFNKAASVALPLCKVTGLVPGSVHTIGIQATDLTTPANTFILPGNGVAGIFWWSP